MNACVSPRVCVYSSNHVFMCVRSQYVCMSVTVLAPGGRAKLERASFSYVVRFDTGKKQASCVAHLVDMKWNRALWAWLFTISSGASEIGDALRNRGRGPHSTVDMRVEGKVTRRIRKRATRQFISEEILRDEVEVGTGALTSDLANGSDRWRISIASRR